MVLAEVAAISAVAVHPVAGEVGRETRDDIVKQHKAESFFSAEERERIERAVESAESLTSGEIATMIVDESDRYREAEVGGALFVAALAALVVAVATRHVTIWTYLPLMALLFFPARFLVRSFPRLKLPFTGRRRLSEAVRQRAVRAFFEKGLYRTRHEIGVLIFMSLLERKVWILGDRGINAKIDPAAWQGMAAELAKGIADNRGCDALCSIIGQCGALLAHHFPHLSDDKNELSDQILTEN